VLFSVGGLFALYEGWHKLQDPHPIDAWQWVPIAVLLAAVVMEGLSFRTAIIESNHTRGSLSWSAFIRRARAPELPVILLEDFAALIGLLFALFGVSLTLITDDGMWDGIGTVMIGALLVAVAVVLALETKSLLLGESATEEDVLAIETALEAGHDIERVIHLRTLHMGPEELLVAAKIAVQHDDTAGSVARAINEAERRVRVAVPIAKFIYIEPDLYVEDRGGAAIPGLEGS
jgi:divalent metal cation (Fe/Co/Zn/Cd) transporter